MPKIAAIVPIDPSVRLGDPREDPEVLSDVRQAMQKIADTRGLSVGEIVWDHTDDSGIVAGLDLAATGLIAVTFMAEAV